MVWSRTGPHRPRNARQVQYPSLHAQHVGGGESGAEMRWLRHTKNGVPANQRALKGTTARGVGSRLGFVRSSQGQLGTSHFASHC